MFQTKKWLIMSLGCLIILGIMSVSKQDVQASSEYEIGSYITCTADTSLYAGPDVNSGVVGSIPNGAIATVVAYSDIYTQVSYGDVTGYLYDEYLGHDDAVIEAYKAQLAAEAEAAEQEALRQSAEIQELAAIIQCEAGSESFDGQLAVGAVVMNRVESGSFPGDIHSVIYQAGQFTPAGSGSVAALLARGGIKQSCLEAAIAAYQGQDNTNGCLYFHRANGQSGLVIDNQVFY